MVLPKAYSFVRGSSIANNVPHRYHFSRFLIEVYRDILYEYVCRVCLKESHAIGATL